MPKFSSGDVVKAATQITSKTGGHIIAQPEDRGVIEQVFTRSALVRFSQNDEPRAVELHNLKEVV